MGEASCTRTFYLGPSELEVVERIKYLGVDFQSNLSWASNKERTLKARVRLAIVRKALIEGISLEAAESLWTTLIRPILEYGAEIWGDCTWREAEQLQREVGRKLLGMGSKACDEAVRGDLGWWTLKGRRDYARLRFTLAQGRQRT